jgi:hypothetical protein
MVSSDIGIAAGMGNLNETPGWKSRNETRVLQGIKQQGVCCNDEGRTGGVIGEDKSCGERVRLQDNMGCLIEQRRKHDDGDRKRQELQHRDREP